MSKIALTISQHFEEIYPAIRDFVDAFVIRDVNALPTIRDIDWIVHMNGFIDVDFDYIVNHAFLERLNAHHVDLFSFDLGPSCEHVRQEEFYKAHGPVLTPEEIIQIGKRKVYRIRSSYSGAISLENLDYHEGGAYEYVCEPNFIRRAIEEFDTYLTLDLGHAEVTCHQWGLDMRRYIRNLPMERLGEVHISHSIGTEDAHGAPTAEELDLLDFVFEIKRPKYVVLEIYSDPDLIVQWTKRLRDYIEHQVQINRL